MYCIGIGISICISVCTVYRYLVSRYVYSVSKYIQMQSAGADNRQMIKLETDAVQPAGERYADRRQMRTAHSQDRQPGRTQTKAGHDEHTQKGARRAQRAFERGRLRFNHIYSRQKARKEGGGIECQEVGKECPVCKM